MSGNWADSLANLWSILHPDEEPEMVEVELDDYHDICPHCGEVRRSIELLTSRVWHCPVCDENGGDQ